MFKIIILLFALSSFFLSYDYLTQRISLPSSLLSAQAQENSLENGIDLTGIWKRDDGLEVYITQTGSEVIGSYSEMLPCEGLENSEHDLEFQGTIDGNQVIGEESAWCYYGGSNPEENGLFFDPFEATISDDGNKLTLFSNNRFTGEEQSSNYIKISESAEGVEASPTDDQGSSTTDQLRDTFTSTLSQVKEPLTSLQENDLPQLLLLAVLGVAVIGGTAAYAKHRSSKKSQQEEEQANVVVITRGGIE